jgi:hypothetical protein
MANSSSLLPAARARALLAVETDPSKVGKPWKRKMSAATRTKLADVQKARWARAKAWMRRKGRLCLQNVTPPSLAMAGGGIDGRKGSDHSHGSMVGAKGEGSLYYLVYRRLKGSDYFPGRGCPGLASGCGRCRINLRSWCWCQECISMRSAEQRSKTEYIELHHDRAAPLLGDHLSCPGITCSRHPAMPHRPQW